MPTEPINGQFSQGQVRMPNFSLDDVAVCRACGGRFLVEHRAMVMWKPPVIGARVQPVSVNLSQWRCGDCDAVIDATNPLTFGEWKKQNPEEHARLVAEAKAAKLKESAADE